MPPIMFKLNQTNRSVYQNGTILAILNLHAAPMPSIKFPLHPTYYSGADNN